MLVVFAKAEITLNTLAAAAVHHDGGFRTGKRHSDFLQIMEKAQIKECFFI